MNSISIGDHPPHDINVLIEIPFGGTPIKYEIEKASGRLFVDRYISTPLVYPGNYGFIPNTLGMDGDPIDVLICDTVALMPGSVINCRPIGVLEMRDEGGGDEKIIAVPSSKITDKFESIKSFLDLPTICTQQIEYFFQHYKDLESSKWVEIKRWSEPERARQLICESIARATKPQRPPVKINPNVEHFLVSEKYR